jgi:hypothetical protein
MEKSDREKKIDSFINNIMTKKEWEKKQNKKINYFYDKYSNELEDYIYIDTIEKYNHIMKGGYIRYFNFNDELRWGGILAKKYDYNNMNMMVLLNTSFKKNIVSFEKNYIFYKKHTTQADKTKKIFMSYLDKYTDE